MVVAKPMPERSELCDSPREEVASAITHGLGAAAAVVGLIFAILVSKDSWSVVSGSIFGASLVFLYLSSTLYHSFTSPWLKNLFQVVDHAGIYLLIAGSYTPLTLVALRGPLGWTIFGIVWVLAITGILTKAFMKTNREHWASTALYLIMGWLVIAIFPALARELSSGGLWLLISGGLSYTLGVIFFVWHKLPFNHAIWHLFVLGGSTCHALSFILFILQ